MPTIVIEHGVPGSTGVVGDLIQAHGLRTSTHRLIDGDQLPSDLDNVDGVLVGDGPISANDDASSWLSDELSFLKAAHDAALPVLGLGVGSHLVARALGGTVAPLEAGAQAGLATINLTPAGRGDALFRGLGWYALWPVWNAEAVSELPADAVVLAKSDACPHEAWHLGVTTYAMQFKVEWNLNALNTACEVRDAYPPGADVDLAAIRAAAMKHADAINRQARRFASNVASYLLRSDKVNAGAYHVLDY